jgi:hypothetical protein
LEDELDASGNINQNHLAISAYCYHIQSETFRIPDRWGWFTPGTPRLRAWQAAFLILPIMNMTIMGSLHLFAAVMIVRSDESVYLKVILNVLFLVMETLVWITSWLMVLWDPRRDPDYRWRDWNIRQA